MIITIDYMENGNVDQYILKNVEEVRIFPTEKFGEIVAIRAGDDRMHFRLDYIVDWGVE